MRERLDSKGSCVFSSQIEEVPLDISCDTRELCGELTELDDDGESATAPRFGTRSAFDRVVEGRGGEPGGDGARSHGLCIAVRTAK